MSFVYMFGGESADEDQFHIDFKFLIDPEPFLLSNVHKDISSQANLMAWRIPFRVRQPGGN